MRITNDKLEILFFYSTSKYESVATKLILNNYLISNSIVERIVLPEFLQHLSFLRMNSAPVIWVNLHTKNWIYF